MTILPITAGNLPVFKAVRLRALQQDPHAFGSTYARESNMAEGEWQQRLVRWSGNRGIGLLAMEGDEARGIIGLLVTEGDATIAEVVSMWVAPESRRTGLGQRLLMAVEDWSRDHGVAHLRLGVTKDNHAALAFYQRNGFALAAPSSCSAATSGCEHTLAKKLK